MKSASKSPKRDENQNFFKEKNYQRLPWKRTDYELKIYQRVVTFVDDAPVRGTVLYIGKEKQSDGLVHTIVGLGLVSISYRVLARTCTLCVQIQIHHDFHAS